MLKIEYKHNINSPLITGQGKANLLKIRFVHLTCWDNISHDQLNNCSLYLEKPLYKQTLLLFNKSISRVFP